MKKKIAILGSTGSIGKKTIQILEKNKKNFDILLLTTNKNISTLNAQVKKFKVKNVIVTSKIHYLKYKSTAKTHKVNIFNNYKSFKRIFKSKLDYVMSSVSGLEGLEPTIKIIKHTKKIAIANKESIVCAWNLIELELKKNKTLFIPVDSEHFSIWSLLKNENLNSVEKIFITASGGPFLNLSYSKMKKINPSIAIKHPKWKMGKKISIDSATMMNKVYEIIEAKRIFKSYTNRFDILIHPDSYLHSIVKFKNGITKLLVHDTDMSIPIYNTIYEKNYQSNLNSNKLNISILNNLKLSKPNKKKFPCLKLLDKIPNKISLFETALISSSDEIVKLFLKKKINFQEIYSLLTRILDLNEIKKLKKKKPTNLQQISNLNRYVRLKTRHLCIR